ICRATNGKSNGLSILNSLATIIQNYNTQQQNRFPTPGEVVENTFPELVGDTVTPNLLHFQRSSENVTNLATSNSLDCNTSENVTNLPLPNSLNTSENVTNLAFPNLVEDEDDGTQKEDDSPTDSSGLDSGHRKEKGKSNRKRSKKSGTYQTCRAISCKGSPIKKKQKMPVRGGS
ncbi:unnamed protein product, partial [Larinioides sclopetarius]